MSLRSSWPRVLAGLVVVLGSSLVSPVGEAADARPQTAALAVPLAAPPTYKATTVSGGGLYTCAVTTKGMPLCWGYNGAGQLGNNTTTSSSVPVGVYGLTKGVKAVATGYSHACALTTKGKVWCWGDNAYGQLGDNTTTSSPKPVAVYGLSKVKSISAGDYTTCALTTKRTVKCWGYGVNGELGNNATSNSSQPVGVYGLKHVTALTNGGYHACALVSGGKPRCWGYNGVGELGNNTSASSAKPVAVYGLTSGVKQITGGTYHTCAVISKGAVRCWGYNAYGQLGNNTTTNSVQPVRVSGLKSGMKSVKAGYGSTCVLSTSGKAKCWGYNKFGQLGDNTTTNRLTPVDAYNLDKASKLAVGYYHACVVTAKKAVKCWGYNTYGGLGNNTTTSSSAPVRVVGF